MSYDFEIFTDGACQGNPGPAGIGIVFYQNNKKIKEISRFIGEATNNIAEYLALITALQQALIFKGRHLKIFMDSELVCRQVSGRYQVKNKRLKPLFDQVCQLLRGFERVEIEHIIRAKNQQADKLAKEAIKRENK